ncbi:MAG TPA: FMN-binding protein [Clostridia bacterium]|nr:FMN-binding protein [Clostridia bacterium]
MKRKYVFIIAALVLIIAAAGVKSYFETNFNRLENLTISDIDLTNVKEGNYRGSHEGFPVSAEVRVTIKDHKITEIEIVRHDNGRGAAAEKITERVIEAQSLDVDAVSGATYSSKVILKAIENALTSGD